MFRFEEIPVYENVADKLHKRCKKVEKTVQKSYINIVATLHNSITKQLQFWDKTFSINFFLLLKQKGK